MDGYAVRAADTPGTLPVVVRIAAGRPAPRRSRPGEAMGIATGGVVPDGADAVVPIEHVVEGDNEIEIPSAVAAGANVRPRGGDVARRRDRRHRRARGSARRRSARSPPPASPRSRARAGRASPS